MSKNSVWFRGIFTHLITQPYDINCYDLLNLLLIKSQVERFLFKFVNLFKLLTVIWLKLDSKKKILYFYCMRWYHKAPQILSRARATLTSLDRSPMSEHEIPFFLWNKYIKDSSSQYKWHIIYLVSLTFKNEVGSFI